jgi:hypothetical protein
MYDVCTGGQSYSCTLTQLKLPKRVHLGQLATTDITAGLHNFSPRAGPPRGLT